MNESSNPCVFKSACKTCNMTASEDRPTMCVSLRCPEFTPCKTCGNNKPLNVNKQCNDCTRASSKKPTLATDPHSGTVVEVQASHAAVVASGNGVDIPTRTIAITTPGTPPGEYTDPEKEYYLGQWNEYISFYRDPTAKALIHNIIILEIELNFLTSWMISRRGSDPLKEFEAQRNRVIHNLGELRNQLPQKEASDESDDERFFSMIYERYVEEKKLRQKGNVARLLSTEAIALAPTLHFPVDPQKLLTNLGYNLVDAIQACDHIVLDDLPQDPTRMLEFLGFWLNEKYAMPLDNEPAVMPEVIPDVVEDVIEPVIEHAIMPSLGQEIETTEYDPEFS